MISTKKKNEAFDILKEYNGDNIHILRLKKQVYSEGNINAMNDFNVEYTLKNHDFKPKAINKTIKIADWYGEKKKEDWGLDFTPEKIKVIFLLGETETTYHCKVQYRQSVQSVECFIPKKAVLTNFLVEDYHGVNVDFSRYDMLADNSPMMAKIGKVHHINENQKEGVKFLLSRKKCVLADDMGYGKTLELSVAAVEGNYDAILIICPASLKTNWRDELMWFVPERDITIIESSLGKTKSELEKMLGYPEGKSNKKVSELQDEFKERGQWKDNKFVILNYDILDKFYEFPKTYSKANIEAAYEKSPILKFISNKKSLIIIDEAHNFSNNKSNRYKVVKNLIKRGNPDSIFLATGTPITNNPSNFYCLLQFLDDPITSDWEYYMTRYCGAIEICDEKDKPLRNRISEEYIANKGKRTWYELSGEQKDELQKLIKKKCKFRLIAKDPTNLDELRDRTSHIYLRRLKEDLNIIPPKYVHEKIYELTDVQKFEYDNLWDEYESAQSEENPDKELNKDLLEGGIYRRYLSNAMVPYTEELVDKILNRGEKVVIACCYDEELYKLKDYYGDRSVIYNGKMDLKAKDKAKNSFMNDPSVMVFIGNIDSCGVGLTLTASRIVVFNNISYVPADDQQMCDRVHRIGQTRDVHIFYQFFRDTQYEQMWNTVLKKTLTIDKVIKKEDDK